MKTYNRGKLKRLALAGKLELASSRHYDDMLGSYGTNQPMPVYVSETNDNRPGECGLYPSDFKSGSGAAWLNPDGTVTLYVHSNCSYTLRIKE